MKKQRVTRSEAERMILEYAKRKCKVDGVDVDGVWPFVRSRFWHPTITAPASEPKSTPAAVARFPPARSDAGSRALSDCDSVLLGAAYSGDSMQTIAAVLSRESGQVTPELVEQRIIDEIGRILGGQGGSTIAIHRTLRDLVARERLVISPVYEESRRRYEEQRLSAELAEWSHQQRLWSLCHLDAADTWLLYAAAGLATEREIGISDHSPLGRLAPDVIASKIQDLSYRLQLTAMDSTCADAREAMREFLRQL